VIKTSVAGFFIGIAGAFAALHYVPAVNLDREVSLITVAPNGGNAEAFHVNIPADRIMLGAQAQGNLLPAGLQWPEEPVFAGVRAELFKVRNARDAVIGVGSRVAVRNEKLGDIIEWTLHLPARGSLYMTLEPANQNGRRTGVLRTGTREFAGLTGAMSERWVADTSGTDPATHGRIEMLATYVGKPEVQDLEEQQ
jgi:hypothetical protein